MTPTGSWEAMRERASPPVLSVVLLLVLAGSLVAQERRTARELGVLVGVMPPGPLNAITDVEGVRIGHVPIVEGDSINTGVTAILPHGGNIFREKVPAAVVIGNGFGKLVGVTQIDELGELESPIILTCTLCVHRAADAVLTYLLALVGNESVRSANVVVGETNDGYLNDIRSRPVRERHVLRAIRRASGGPLAQGAVGAGRGTVAFGFKGGIGTASRRLPDSLGGWTVGVLGQTNFGGALTIAGVPVGRELGMVDVYDPSRRGRNPGDDRDGSIMIVVATDAPMGARSLTRLARRALVGVARTGSAMSSGSGDYVIAFSTVTIGALPSGGGIRGRSMSPLFIAVAEATEEAIYNSLFMATEVRGHRGIVRALPVDSTLSILERYGALRR